MVLVLSAGFTTFYSIRLIYLVFLSNPRGYKTFYASARENLTFLMVFGMSLLFFGSLFSGFILYDLFLGLGSDFFSGSIYSISGSTILVKNVEFMFLQNKSV